MVSEKPVNVMYCFTKCKFGMGYCLIRAIVVEGRIADTEAVPDCRETNVLFGKC